MNHQNMQVNQIANMHQNKLLFNIFCYISKRDEIKKLVDILTTSLISTTSCSQQENSTCP